MSFLNGRLKYIDWNKTTVEITETSEDKDGFAYGSKSYKVSLEALFEAFAARLAPAEATPKPKRKKKVTKNE